jgi:hypothetical protein
MVGHDRAAACFRQRADEVPVGGQDIGGVPVEQGLAHPGDDGQAEPDRPCGAVVVKQDIHLKDDGALTYGLEPHRPGNGDATGVGTLGRGHVSQWHRPGRRECRDA